MRGEDIRAGVAVTATVKGAARPAVVSHTAERDVWVSFTDAPTGQAKVTARALEPRR